MLQNILEGESRSLTFAYDQYSSPRRPATILFDFGNAFPSLSHDFLWLALQYIGVPTVIINAIKELYKDNKHFWRYRGPIRVVYTAQSGVKQGGPLSALLFIIAVDPFLNFLSSRIPRCDLLIAYADDIAVVLRDL